MKGYTIELDCAPMTPRPSAYLPGVLAGTGVILDPQKPDGTMFGNWTWAIPEDQEAQFEANRDTIAERIRNLYHNGQIRYGSW